MEHATSWYSATNTRTLVITRKLSESAKWGEDEIRARGQTLAELAKKVWFGPAGIDLKEFA